MKVYSKETNVSNMQYNILCREQKNIIDDSVKKTAPRKSGCTENVYNCKNYIDFQKTSSSDIGSSTKKLLLQDSQMFTNKKLIVNPNCPMQLILDYVYQEVGISKDCDFDFATNRCNFLNIKSYNPSTCGLDAFVPKETYFLVLFERDNYGNKSKIMPILNKHSKEYSEFIVHMRKISTTKQIKRPSVVNNSLSSSKRSSARSSVRSLKLSTSKGTSGHLKESK